MAFLDRAAEGPAGLVIEGEPGAGKTTLWQAAIAGARSRDMQVLVSRPSESDSTLPFAALGDLLEGSLDHHAGLPEPQLRALRVATLLEDPEASPPDQRAVSVATANLLRAMAARSPVLVAVDDAQCLDQPTARVLEFVLRRLELERVGFLAARRPADDGGQMALRDVEIGVGRPDVVRPAPLGPDELDTLFRGRLSASFPRPVLRQVAAASGGNPMFALEIGHAIRRGEISPAPGERLAVPTTLQELVRERVAVLPREVRELLFIVAAVAEPTFDLLARYEPDRDATELLHPALAAGVIAIVDDRIRFTHPLFGATLYHAVPAGQRRRLHGRLATLVSSTQERARQLSLGSTGPDPTVAAALAESAAVAASRGAPDAAAELAEQAVRLTPRGDHAELRARRLQAAEFHFGAGDSVRARAGLERLVKATPRGPERADVLRRLATVRYRTDSVSTAAALLGHALEEVGEDGPLRAAIERDLAWAVTLCGDVRDAQRHAESALAQIGGSADRDMPELLAARAMARFLGGHGLDEETMERAIAAERSAPGVPIEWRPSMTMAMMRTWAGDLGDARARFAALRRVTVEAGDEISLPFLLAQQSEAETWAGDAYGGVAAAELAHGLALQTGQEPIRAVVLAARALAEAHLGRVEAARASALDGLRLAEATGSVVTMMQNQGVLGFVHLSCDEPALADARLGPLVAWLDVVGIREPGVMRFVPDAAEALIALGAFDRADALLESFEADARRLGRGWAILAATRVRAMRQAATGETAAAIEGLEEALDGYGAGAPPLELGRALLVLGTIQRRTLQRKASRASLTGALERFETLGAVQWADKTRALLGGLASANESDTAPTLTPAEQRVVDLVAAGATNRAAADRLFVSVRAVEVHLTNVYRKLGIRSRTELAALVAGPRTTAGPALEEQTA